MPEIFRSPFFYIVLGCALVFLYAIIAGIHRGKKGGKGKGDGKTDKSSTDEKGGDKKEEVTTYDEFKATPEKETTPTLELSETSFIDDINKMEVPPFEEQAYDFFNDIDNQTLFNDMFGDSSYNMFSPSNSQSVDYTIKEYDYNKVWETEPDAIGFDYDNYDVNYVPPKKQPRIKKQIKNLNKVQKAILFADVLNRKSIKSSWK